MKTPDEELIARVQQGDRNAFSALYRRYAAWGMPLLERPTDPDEVDRDAALRIAIVGADESDFDLTKRRLTDCVAELYRHD